MTSHSILSAYVDAGGNLIDTADVYSVWAPNNAGGVSEEIIGRWLKATGNRDRVLVATKVRGAMGQNFSEGDDHPLQREGLSRRWILRACADSLRRLQVDYIDLYQAHYIDPRTPIEETLSAFTDLVRKGYVRYIGCSNFSAWRLMQALWDWSFAIQSAGRRIPHRKISEKSGTARECSSRGQQATHERAEL